MKVTVVYATAAAQDCVPLVLPDGSTAIDAIGRSGLLGAWQLDLASLVIAVRGNAVVEDAPLSDGDRVELLPPISADPKEARRRRAAGRSRAGPDAKRD